MLSAQSSPAIVPRVPFLQAAAIRECARLYVATRESKACQAFYNHAIRARLLAIQDKDARHAMAQEALAIVRAN